MSKYDFLLQVEQNLKTRSEVIGASVSSHICVKNNDTEVYGISINFNPEKVSPVFYVGRFYDDYCRKKLTVDETVDSILASYKALEAERAEHSDVSLNFEDCSDRIVYRLVSLKKNKKYLEDIPHVIWLDLAIIFTVVYKQSDSGLESIKINYELMDSWEKNTSDLFELAKINTPRLFPAVIKDLSSVLGIEELDVETDMLILSNKQYVFGAAAIMYDGIPERIADIVKGDYYVIPSSVHEVLILPNDQVEDPEDINCIISQINTDCLISTDILSDRAYFYSRQEKRFHF